MAERLWREKWLYRYSAALERGDFQLLAALLAEAEKDRQLERMLLELNAAHSQQLGRASMSAQDRRSAVNEGKAHGPRAATGNSKRGRAGRTKRAWASLGIALGGLAALVVVLGVVALLIGPAAGSIVPVELRTIRQQIAMPLSPAGTASEVGPTYGGVNPVNDEPYADVFFDSEGVNPFIDTEVDPLSTFALDVDTGSYTVTRRYLRDGYLPPKEAIRVEEFVNYFDYGYPPPQDSAFAIYLEGGPTPFVQGDRYRVLRVGIQGFDVPDEARKEAVLTFVIDISGSMDMENRLGAVKSALRGLVESLRPTDQVGIVVYGSRGQVVLEPTFIENRETILAAIESLAPGGSTNAEEGLVLGYQLATQAFRPGAINRVILCSDGVANVGNTGAESILKSIRQHAREGITLTTVGFGMGNYNDTLMERLADEGDGFYAYVDTQAEARRLFVHDLTGTLQTIAMQAKVQVDFNPEAVELYRLIGFENRALADEDFRDDSVDAGEIGAGHSVTALYEIKLAEGAQGELATVYLRWEDPDSGEVSEISELLQVADLRGSFQETSPSFKLAVYVAQFAEILRQSIWAEDFTLAGLAEHLETFNLAQFDSPAVVEFGELVRQAVVIRGDYR